MQKFVVLWYHGQLYFGGKIMKYEKFIRERITELREQRGISEYKLSYTLKRSKGYIHNITSGKALPSLKELFAIINYFGLTPSEFFKKEKRYSGLIKKAVKGMSSLTDTDLKALLVIIGHMSLLRGIVNDLLLNQEKMSENNLLNLAVNHRA